MTNVVIPLAANLFFDANEYFYPKPLIEVRGTPIIELVLKSLETLPNPKRYIFLVNRQDNAKFHLADTLKLLAGPAECEVLVLDGPTKGAACTVLMAIKWIGSNDPLIVANGDQVFKFPLTRAIESFKKQNVDAGVITFNSVHPRWSYVRLEHGQVVEAVEKRPLSRNAIAGFYYFNQGSEFVRLTCKHIEKGRDVNGQFYVAPVLNEFVLEDKKIGAYTVPADQFQSFYSIQKIEEAQRDAI